MEVLETLVLALRRLPTIGPKTARRLALHVLQRDREAGQAIAEGQDSRPRRQRRQ